MIEQQLGVCETLILSSIDAGSWVCETLILSSIDAVETKASRSVLHLYSAVLNHNLVQIGA